MIALRNLIAVLVIISSSLSSLNAGKSSVNRTGNHPERHKPQRSSSSSSLEGLPQNIISQKSGSRPVSPVDRITISDHFFMVETYDIDDFLDSLVIELRLSYLAADVDERVPAMRKLIEKFFDPAYVNGFIEQEIGDAKEKFLTKLAFEFRRARRLGL